VGVSLGRKVPVHRFGNPATDDARIYVPALCNIQNAASENFNLLAGKYESAARAVCVR
jgi:hypothetical protein